MPSKPALLVFSHLRWNFVHQRPQHLLSRLSNNRQVIFVEEPVLDQEQPPYWEFSQPTPQVTVCRPHTAVEASGFHRDQLPILRDLIAELLNEQAIEDYVAWFYTPMAVPLLEHLAPQLVVYDCMDALDTFLHAPAEIREREAELTTRSDLIFTGGPSLYHRKKDQHARVYCFPSSVDAGHFAQAKDRDLEAVEQRALGQPRLGYFGVIDERIDASMIELVARTHPDWQIVMVGPVVKISPESLPQLPNIHYFGQQPYTALPRFLAGWDVCLMPFALNEATRFISPTKVLEYMAAERPIVSTMIADVSGPYGGIVHLARSPQHFVECCEQAVALSGDALDDILARMREVLQHTSWDRTAQQMEALIDAELTKSTPLPLQQAGRPRTPPPIHRLRGLTHRMPSRNAPNSPVPVIGAGPTGLSATYHLGKDAVLLERNGTVGGWCRSMEVDGFTFDYAGHIMFSNDPYVHDMYQMLLGDNVHWQDREAWVYSHGVYTRYPFQGSLHGLPRHVIKECIMGAIEARHGSVKSDAPPATTSDKPIRVAAPGTKGTASTNGSPRSNHASDNNGHFNRNGNLQNRIARSLVDRDTRRGAIHTTTNGATHGKTTNGEPRGECLTDCCADGVLESTARLIEIGENKTEARNTPGPKNFEEFIYKVWGRGIAKHFAVPYNRKLWAVPLAEMETSWLGGRVPLPDLEEIIDGALAPVAKPMGPNARFGYPLRGGFQALMDGFLPYLQDQLRLNCGVATVSPSRQEVTLTDGTVMSFDYLISTMPLPLLIRSMGQEAPAEVQAAVAKLRYVSVRCVHLGIGRAGLTEKHWIYYPEDSVFHRIFVQGNASPHCNPPGGFGLTCEITYSPHKPLPCDGDALIQRCIDDCRRVGIITPEDPVIAATQVDLPHAYVVYDHSRAAAVAVIRDWLATRNILLAGRYSEWEYYNSDHAFLAGKRVAEQVQQLRERQTTPALASNEIRTN